MSETRRRELKLGNLDCENDAARLRRGLEATPGVVDVRIKAKAGKLEVGLAHDFSDDALSGRLAELGFPEQADDEPAGLAPPWRNSKVLASVVSGLLWAVAGAASWASSGGAVVWVLQLASTVVGAFYFAREAIEELVHDRRVGIELLMTIAAVLAFLLGHPGEAAMLAFLYSISEAAEGYTEERTRGAVRALMKLAPRTATVVRDGRMVTPRGYRT